MDLMDYLKSAKKSLFRFEYLQEFKAGEDGNIDQWRKTGEIDENLFKEWWNFLEGKHKEGVITQRVRRIMYPLNEYTQWELQTHKLSIQHGDDIRKITDDEFHKLNICATDFWFIDDSVVLIMKYSNEGKYLGFSIESDIATYLKYKEALLNNSEPI
jgi:hypothetical protein